MPPVTIYWYHHAGGDAYTPPGMTAEEARKIPGKGPQVGPAAGQGGFSRGPAVARKLPAAVPVAPVLPAALAALARPVLVVAAAVDRRRPGQRLQQHLRRLERATWAPADAGKASACFLGPVGRNTSCPTPTCNVRPARAPAPTTRRMRAIGSVPAKAERRPAPISASPDHTPSGWCSAPPPFTTKAS